jgi:hypothetical protein
MVRTFSLRLAAGLVGFAGLLPAAAPATATVSPASPATQPHWSSARLMSGVGGDWSEPVAISCTGLGDCTAGGVYGWFEPYTQSLPFVVTETNSKWGSAKNVTGIPALDGEQYAAVTSVSCAWPGNCAAAGYYLPTAAADATAQAFVVDQVNGTWQPAHRLAGVTARVNVGEADASWIITVSCAPAKTSAARKMGLDCLAVGGALNVKGSAEVDAVDCPVAGECAAAGDYLSKSGAAEFFVVNATGGTWRGAIQVPGLVRLGSGADLEGTGLAEVSCTPTTCEVGGTMWTNPDDGSIGFLVGEARGRWGAPHLVPGPDPTVAALSCPAAGDCTAGGTVTSPDFDTSGIVLNQVNGIWGKPVTVAPSEGIDGEVTALSCAAARNCAAVGYLPDGRSGGPWAAVATEAAA